MLEVIPEAINTYTSVTSLQFKLILTSLNSFTMTTYISNNSLRDSHDQNMEY